MRSLTRPYQYINETLTALRISFSIYDHSRPTNKRSDYAAKRTAIGFANKKILTGPMPPLLL
jgi:protein subunit release factor B